MEENHGPYFRTAVTAQARGASDQKFGRWMTEISGSPPAPVCWSGAVCVERQQRRGGRCRKLLTLVWKRVGGSTR